MIKEAIKANTGILFDEAKLNRYGLTLPQPCRRVQDPDGVEENPKEDACYYLHAKNQPDRIADLRAPDVASPSYVDYSPAWWPLEFLPVLERKQASSGQWVWKPQYVTPLFSKKSRR